MAAGEHRRCTVRQLDADDRGDRFAATRAVVFTHADQALVRRVDHCVGVALARFFGECLRRFIGADAPELLVGVVREEACAPAHRESAAAIFVHAAAHVQWRRREVLGAAVGAAPDEHVAALLLRPAFGPEDVALQHRELAEANGLADDQLGADGRGPAAERRGHGLGQGFGLRRARLLAPHEQKQALDLLARPRRLAQELQARHDARVGGEAFDGHTLAEFGPAEVRHQLGDDRLERQPVQRVVCLRR